jgi:hypothetical protein
VTRKYRLRTSPNNVLYNLNLAYVEMDAERYLDCLAQDFEFILNPDDVNNPENPLPEYWGKQEERDIHERMFSDTTNVDRIDLTLTNISTNYDQGADPGDPNDDRFTYMEGTDLRVHIGDWTFLMLQDQQFVFMIDPDETGPNGEVLWEIVEWRDLRPPDRVEDCSWGRIKSMFR